VRVSIVITMKEVLLSDSIILTQGNINNTLDMEMSRTKCCVRLILTLIVEIHCGT
jgi:hypothetical protein